MHCAETCQYPGVGVIPFYGAGDRAMFEIERRAMDRPGRVLAALDRRLPTDGLVLDVGAGDGFTADRLSTDRRSIVPLEPARGMIRPERSPRWVQGEAERLPFATASFDAAYATWAYFFTAEGWDPSGGIAELHRVVRPGGPLLIVDNLGDDEFLGYVEDGPGHCADPARWRDFGFEMEEVVTAFVFDDLEEARTLLGFFFGEPGRRNPSLQIGFRVALFHRESSGPPP